MYYRKIVSSLLLPLSLSTTASAVDYSFSGFATLGGTISDQPYTYRKYIDDEGTYRKDTLAGLQLDTKLNNEVSLTVQGKVAQSLKDDTRYDPTLTWAFLSYRPTNDWLFRAGKVRIPFYLESQNEDVGSTYDFARLPDEVYALSPYDNGVGGLVSKSFELPGATLTADAFYININVDSRTYIPGVGPYFSSNDVDVKGLSLLYETEEDNRLRGGYYKTAFLSYDIDIYTLGLDYRFDDSWRVMSEYVRMEVPGYPAYYSAYASLLKSIGDWTPYLTYAFSEPDDSGEYSYTFGTSYSVTPLQKLKMEVKHIRTGENPRGLIDFTEPAAHYQNERMTLGTIVYTVAF